MNNSDDANDNVLAGIDLHVWRVPPASAARQPDILLRALTPAIEPQRSRIAWVLVAVAVVSVAIAALVLVRPGPETKHVVVTAPAGPLQDKADELRREIERRQVEIDEMKRLIDELSEKVRRYENNGLLSVPPPPRPQPKKQPAVARPAADASTCDEVSCVLQNYTNGCCDKYRKVAPAPPNTKLPTALDRTQISNGISSVKSSVSACSQRSTAQGTVKLRVKVSPDGLVTNVVVESTPDPVLGACVAAAVQAAVFNRTQLGGSFSYPFVF